MSTESPSESTEPLTIKGIVIPVDQQTPLVLALVAVIQQQDLENQQMRDEVHRLNKTTRRPNIKPSKLLDAPPPARLRQVGDIPLLPERM